MFTQSRFLITFAGEIICTKKDKLDSNSLEFGTNHPGATTSVIGRDYPHLSTHGNITSSFTLTICKTYSTPAIMQDMAFRAHKFWGKMGLGNLIFENAGIKTGWEARITSTNIRTSVEGSSKNRLYITLNFEKGKELELYA